MQKDSTACCICLGLACRLPILSTVEDFDQQCQLDSGLALPIITIFLLKK